MLREGGNVEDVASGMDEYAVRQPLGVFATIVPFNVLAMIPLWFLPYAVATGDSFILKPSERIPLSSQIIFEAVDPVNFPDSVVNLANGEKDTVNALLEHETIEGVSFVGSSEIAHHVYETAAKSGKCVQAQAKNYAVVSGSAELDRAVSNILGSVYGNAGQCCLANDIVVSVGDVHDELRERIVGGTEEPKVGYGVDEDTDIGPVITPEPQERIPRPRRRRRRTRDGRPCFEHPDYPEDTS